MSISNALMLDIQLVKHDVPAEGTLEERFTATAKKIRSGRSNMMTGGNDEEQFRICVGALMLSVTEEERERISEEMRVLQTLSAMISGVPVDFERLPKQENPIGLTRLWREASPTGQKG